MILVIRMVGGLGGGTLLDSLEVGILILGRTLSIRIFRLEDPSHFEGS